MESLNRLVCFKGNQAQRMCATSQCKQNSLMCGTPRCDCSKQHSKCLLICPVYTLKQMLIQKAHTKSPYIKLIEQWLASRLKELTVQLESIRAMLDSPTSQLTGNEGKLFELIKEGKSQEITPLITSSVIESLRNEDEMDFNLEHIKKSIENEAINFNTVMKNIVSLIDFKPTSSVQKGASSISISKNHKFSSTYRNNLITLVTDRVARSTQADCWKSILFEKSVEQLGNFKQVYEIKVRKSSKNWFRFGLCHLNAAKKHFGDLTGGYCYLVRAEEGTTISWKKQGNIAMEAPIKTIQPNETLHVIYSPKHKTLEFLNIDKKQRTVLNTMRIEGDPLYFCVQMNHQGDEVELIKVDLVKE